VNYPIKCDKCGLEIKGAIYNRWPRIAGSDDLGRDWEMLHPECAMSPLMPEPTE